MLGLLEKAGLITRGPSPDDERATLVTITNNGRALFGRVLPGHIQVTRLLFDRNASYSAEARVTHGG